MNTFITLACLLVAVGVSHCNPSGYGGGLLLAPPISTANMYKATPIPVIRTASITPIIAPAVTTIPLVKNIGYGGWGLGGLGYGGLGYGGLGYGGLGYSGLNYGLGWGGKGMGHGLDYGYGGKIYG